MNYADIKIADVANGKGVRVSLFVSGCNHHCKDVLIHRHGTLIMEKNLQKKTKKRLWKI